MKLDNRLTGFPFTCFSTKLAAHHIGKKGYFANNLDDFSDLLNTSKGTLDKVYDDMPHAFYRSESCSVWRFFYPEEYLVKETTYKPFSPATFEQYYSLGETIIYRGKENKLTFKAIISAIVNDENSKEFYIVLGGNTYTLDELFNKYEICENDTWHAFGVEE